MEKISIIGGNRNREVSRVHCALDGHSGHDSLLRICSPNHNVPHSLVDSNFDGLPLNLAVHEDRRKGGQSGDCVSIQENRSSRNICSYGCRVVSLHNTSVAAPGSRRPDSGSIRVLASSDEQSHRPDEVTQESRP